MSHQNGILHSSWLTSRNATPSIGSVYKVPTLFAPFLFHDVIADKAFNAEEGGSDISATKKYFIMPLNLWLYHRLYIIVHYRPVLSDSLGFKQLFI